MTRPREPRCDLTWNRRNLAGLGVLCVLGGGILMWCASQGRIPCPRCIPVDLARIRSATERIDPNVASIASMRRLPGIGPQKATAILAERRNGPYRQPDELVRVHGIGPRTVEKLRVHLDIPGECPTRSFRE